MTELFVVIVVLAMSAAILLPAATLDKEKAQRGICLNNLRQLGLATRFYADDHHDFLPWPNWGASAPDAGWLFSSLAGAPYGLVQYNQNPGRWQQIATLELKAGTFYQYVGNWKTYQCPLDPPGNPLSSWPNRANQLSSYVMNSCAAFFTSSAGSANEFGYKTMKITQIRSPNSILMWEPSFTSPVSLTSDLFNDGSNLPNSSEGPAGNHGGDNQGPIALVNKVDGSSEFISLPAYSSQEVMPAGFPANQNFLWWAP